MPGHGPLPKPTASRPSDLRRKTATREKCIDDGKLRGPALPKDMFWHTQTQAWWNTWRRSPLSANWLETDWDFLLDTALMHSAMWNSGAWTMAAELRLRVAKLGATVEDRQRLRVSIEQPKRDETSVAVMDQYRAAAGE